MFIAIGGSVFSLYLRQALHDARAADEEKTEELWQSHLQRARALRSSGREGQRFAALKAIREAAKIKVTPELRDEAVAALDLEPLRAHDAVREPRRARAAPVVVILHAAADVERMRHVVADVVEQTGREVGEEVPRLRAVV